MSELPRTSTGPPSAPLGRVHEPALLLEVDSADPITPLLATGALASAPEGYEVPVDVVVRDGAGEAVFTARVRMWVSPRR